MKLVLSCLLLSLVLLTGCAPSVPPASKTALDYYRDGEEQFARGDYREALESFEKVRDIYESADLNMQAALKIADTHYAREDYVEAATAYEDFLKQHPGHPQTARVLYQLGKSYFQQILAIDRDQTATRNAMVAFESLLNLYPDAPQSREAPELIRHCRDQLAESELYVGRFYLKTDEYAAAIGRLHGILDAYPDFSGMDKVHFYLGLAYLENGNPPLAALQLETLLKEYPRSELIGEAEDVLHDRF
jgi:outer membrane protein assembly factor BamD